MIVGSIVVVVKTVIALLYIADVIHAITISLITHESYNIVQKQLGLILKSLSLRFYKIRTRILLYWVLH